MISILKREFMDSFKSIRSILIILFVTYMSYLSSTFLQDNPDLINLFTEEGIEAKEVYTAAISWIILLLGFLFVFAVSHDLINKEVETKTMRLLVTKISRIQIVLGKFLGALLFWIVVFSISFGVLTIIAGEWFPKDYFRSLSFVFYVVGFVLCLSTLISRTRLSMFLGILLGIAIPIIGLTSLVSDKWYLKPFEYILPYKYMEGSIGWILISLVIGLVYVGISILLMKRKDF